MKILYLSTFPPRECGIATFNQSLINGIQTNFKRNGGLEQEFIGVALNDSDELNEYEYPESVKFVIRQENEKDYLKAAELINNSNTDVCILQHEFGIFGGQSGIYSLPLLHRVEKPVVTVLHTILKEPSFIQKIIIQEIARQSARLVVLNKRSISFLTSIYNVPGEKIKLIEHGVPDIEPPIINPVRNFPSFKNKKLLMTFGLLNRGKGLETVIRALPKIVEKYPETIYAIVGNTHPVVAKVYGEEYRDSLKLLAKELQVDRNLVFINRFLPERELVNYLSAADVFITPYVNEAQISSGTLSYAIGAGAAALSTPYWHASELLSENRGLFFDFRDANGLASVVNDLFDNPQKLAELRENAYQYGRQIRWPNIAGKYLSLLNEVLNTHVEEKKEIKQIINPDLMPKFSLAHVLRLTDDTGIVQHAKYGIPNLKEGYCLDDNARALIMTLMLCQQKKNQEALKLLPVYLSYIQYMQRPDGNFGNFLSFDRQYRDEIASEDAFGRTIWALGFLISNPPTNSYREFADELFDNSKKHFKTLKSIRGYANTLIGVSYFLRARPGHEEMFRVLIDLTDTLVDAYKAQDDNKWLWFEDMMTYDNAILPLALFHSAEITGDEDVKKIAIETLGFLGEIYFRNDYLAPVGNNKWYNRNNGKQVALYDQQAIETMGMVLVYFQAYESTQDPRYIQKMFRSYLWFLGENSLRVPLYDHETKGCCDGLQSAGINRNQGAESTLAYIISYLTVLKAFEKEYQFQYQLPSEVETFSQS
ncbi:MAG TPA: glycosyltransferase [Chitinophagaceae bacterium]|nr:glycosyltransferase [Chitinophagaceae bacterium]